MQTIILSWLLILSSAAMVTGQTFDWAKQIGGNGQNQGTSITVDASGNIYTTGIFAGTSDFDPGLGTSNLSSTSNTLDIFVSKLDASGNFVWAKNMGGISTEIGNSIAVDASGNVYTTGYFGGTADFDPGAGTFNLISGGSRDAFISKLDASGNFVWAKGMGGTSDDRGRSITVDASGNIYITGFFRGTVDFDPGVGIFNLTPEGQNDVFVLKLDASGNFVWAKNMGGVGGEVSAAITLDATGNVYTIGTFPGVADFDPGAGTFNLTAEGFDVFISKLDASGNFVWAKAMGGSSTDWGFSITVDGSGNVYSTGQYQGTADFDPGAGTHFLTSGGLGGRATFISKLDASGNFIWAKNIDAYQGNSILVDLAGNVYTTGYFFGTVDFDPGAGIFNLTSAGSSDAFISKLDASGNFVWANQIEGTSVNRGHSLALDAAGNVYTTGYFQGTADFDPDAGTFNLTSAGGSDIFVHKISNGNPLPIELLDFQVQEVEERAVLIQWQTATETNNDFFTLERSRDAVIWEILATIDGAGNSSSVLHYATTDPLPLQGTSYYRLKQTDFDGRFEYFAPRAIRFERLSSSSVHIYPSPATNTITLEGPEPELKTIELYNLAGQNLSGMVRILPDEAASGRVIDLSLLPMGHYLVRTATEAHKILVIK